MMYNFKPLLLFTINCLSTLYDVQLQTPIIVILH